MHRRDIDQVEEEVAIHIHLTHPNILGLFAAFADDSHLYIVLELASGDDLYKRMSRIPPSEQLVVRRFITPILAALEHCHSRGILHRDLKVRVRCSAVSTAQVQSALAPSNPVESPRWACACTMTRQPAHARQRPRCGRAIHADVSTCASVTAGGPRAQPENVLMTEDGTCKLCDFGFSINTALRRPVSRLGTLDFMAPEIVMAGRKHLDGVKDEVHNDADNYIAKADRPSYTSAIDVWAVGGLLYELLVRTTPFASSSKNRTMRKIVAGDVHIPESLTPHAADFIRQCLRPPPGERPSATRLLAHPLIAAHCPQIAQAAHERLSQVRPCSMPSPPPASLPGVSMLHAMTITTTSVSSRHAFAP